LLTIIPIYFFYILILFIYLYIICINNILLVIKLVNICMLYIDVPIYFLFNHIVIKKKKNSIRWHIYSLLKNNNNERMRVDNLYL